MLLPAREADCSAAAKHWISNCRDRPFGRESPNRSGCRSRRRWPRSHLRRHRYRSQCGLAGRHLSQQSAASAQRVHLCHRRLMLERRRKVMSSMARTDGRTPCRSKNRDPESCRRLPRRRRQPAHHHREGNAEGVAYPEGGCVLSGGACVVVLAVCEDLGHVGLRPVSEATCHIVEREAELGQLVGDGDRNGWRHGTGEQAVAFQ